jgi:hypothetical protein
MNPGLSYESGNSSFAIPGLRAGKSPTLLIEALGGLPAQ